MPGSQIRTPSALDDLERSAGEAAAVRDDLRAVLSSLEDARREFNVWLGDEAPPERVEPPPRPEPWDLREEPVTVRRGPRFRSPEPAPAPPRPVQGPPPVRSRFDLNDAESEARAYLEDAKRRVDTLVETMLGSVEQEAWALRRETEEGIRSRWNEVEAEAVDYLIEARRSAERLVEQRRLRICELSDAITRGSERVTARLEDADRVRSQFDRLVWSLSMTADRIASDIEGTGHVHRFGERLDRR